METFSLKGYAKCICGAITIFTTAHDYSCKQINFKKFFPDVDLHKLKKHRTTYACNHCANNYGLDLCGCGSGEDFGRCDYGLEECNKPMQKIGEYFNIVAKNAWK